MIYQQLTLPAARRKLDNLARLPHQPTAVTPIRVPEG